MFGIKRRSFVWALGLFAAMSWIKPQVSLAGPFEISLGFNYNRTNYSEGNYTWSRRYGASVAYHFWSTSSLEWSYALAVERTVISGLQDTTFNDQIYSLNWIQGLSTRDAIFQPYVKGGLGQLNRNASGTYSGGVSPPPFTDSLTGVIGAGAKVFLTKSFGLRFEATSYIQNAELRTWKDNLGFTFGTTIYF